MPYRTALAQAEISKTIKGTRIVGPDAGAEEKGVIIEEQSQVPHLGHFDHQGAKTTSA